MRGIGHSLCSFFLIPSKTKKNPSPVGETQAAQKGLRLSDRFGEGFVMFSLCLIFAPYTSAQTLSTIIFMFFRIAIPAQFRRVGKQPQPLAHRLTDKAGPAAILPLGESVDHGKQLLAKVN